MNLLSREASFLTWYTRAFENNNRVKKVYNVDRTPENGICAELW